MTRTHGNMTEEEPLQEWTLASSLSRSEAEWREELALLSQTQSLSAPSLFTSRKESSVQTSYLPVVMELAGIPCHAILAISPG